MDAKTDTTKSLTNIRKLLTQDLEAIPADGFDRTFGGKSRTVADLVYEVNLVNDHVGMVVRGEEPFDWPEGWIKAPESARGKAEAIRSFEESAAHLIDTVNSLSEAQLTEPFIVDGHETTRWARFRFLIVHMWYHSGQLNFIQTLLGDDAWHWT